ncbi:MAG: hypothetical protein ACOC80_13950 [Petrotogales bacterium]
MSKGTIVGIGVIGVSVIIALSLIAWIMGIYNTEIELSNSYDAQFNTVETTLDTMRKTIMNQYKVNQDYADKFIQVVSQQTEGRKGGALFKSSTEAANKLGMSSELYTKMINSIEGQMASFKRSQDTLTDVWRSHKTFCQRIPNSWFIGGRVKEKPEMISSTISKKVVETKELDDNLLPSQ